MLIVLSDDLSLQDIQHLAPATDFYKKLALDCSGQQVAVDLFLLSAQYCDLASLGKSQLTCMGELTMGGVKGRCTSRRPFAFIFILM